MLRILPKTLNNLSGVNTYTSDKFYIDIPFVGNDYVSNIVSYILLFIFLVSLYLIISQLISHFPPYLYKLGVGSTVNDYDKALLFRSRIQVTGFTLIELLVVIAIIAIISVIAIALFGNVQGDARDGKRRAELEGIANVLEVNKVTGGYQQILATQFGGGLMPGNTLAPAPGPNNAWAIDAQNRPYCIAWTATGTIPPADAVCTTPTTCTGGASNWTANVTPLAAGGVCPTGYTAIQNNVGTPANNASTYKTCTLLEKRGTLTVFCRTNVQ